MRSLLALFVLASCASSPSAGVDAGAVDVGRDAGALGVALGVGLTTWTALPTAGAEVELVFGPQGGWHFDLGARVTAPDVEGVTLEYAVRDPATGQAMHHAATVTLNARRVLREGDGWLRVGDRAVLDVPDGNALVGRSLELSVLAAAPGGARARDLRRVTVVDRVR